MFKMSSSIKIKFQNHFKLYISLKDKIIFENELIRKGIGFYVDYENQPSTIIDVRYFLLDRDRHKIDTLLKETQIIADAETISLSDYPLVKKMQYLYLKIFIIVTVIMILIVIYDNLKSKI